MQIQTPKLESIFIFLVIRELFGLVLKHMEEY